MTAIQIYMCPMCGSQREEVQTEGEPLLIRSGHCRFCGARMYNYFILKAHGNSWFNLMQVHFPQELSEMIDQLKQVKDVNHL